jgi:hypothetical protein
MVKKFGHAMPGQVRSNRGGTSTEARSSRRVGEMESDHKLDFGNQRTVLRGMSYLCKDLGSPARGLSVILSSPPPVYVYLLGVNEL